MMSPCIDGLAKAPDARRLYRWQDAGQLERFGTLVRLGLDATAAERAELTRLKTLFDDADRVQRITAMEFDAVLLNSHAAVVCEAKSSLTSEQLTKFDDTINRVLWFERPRTWCTEYTKACQCCPCFWPITLWRAKQSCTGQHVSWASCSSHETALSMDQACHAMARAIAIFTAPSYALLSNERPPFNLLFEWTWHEMLAQLIEPP